MDPIKEKYDVPCGATKSYFHPKIKLKKNYKCFLKQSLEI